MNEVLFIRHGATAGNLEKRYIGRTDEPLCEAGAVQLGALDMLPFRPDILFVSPMLRTRQTAELLFPGRDCTVVDDLRETDFGVFEGKNAAELSDNAAYRAWVDSGCTAPIPGGERVGAFKRRCRAAFASAMETVPAGSRAAFVLHGGGIMAILEAFADPPRGFYDSHIGNGEALLCIWDGGALRGCREYRGDDTI